jgi:hypothetical protein
MKVFTEDTIPVYSFYYNQLAALQQSENIWHLEYFVLEESKCLCTVILELNPGHGYNNFFKS